MVRWSLPALALVIVLGLLVYVAQQDKQQAQQRQTKQAEAAGQQKPKVKETAQQIKNKKSQFFNTLAPKIQIANTQVIAERQQLLAWYRDYHKNQQLAEYPLQQLSQLAKRYRYAMPEQNVLGDAWWQGLLQRVDVIPPSLALAQSANESAWGRSRFASEGNNYFGQWCFSTGCGIVPAQRPEDAIYEVQVFDSVQLSVEAYFLNLNSHSAYQPLRDIRATLQAQGRTVSGLELAKGLTAYSSRGQAYVKELQVMIRFNKLSRLDEQLKQQLELIDVPSALLPPVVTTAENTSSSDQAVN